MLNKIKLAWSGLSDILGEADEMTKYTPDIAELETKKWQHFLFYDETSIDNRKYDLIKDHIVNWTPAYTRDKYHTWKKNLGVESFPVPFEVSGFASDSARIKGDLMSIESSHVPVLDNHKHNGVQFLRKSTAVVIPIKKFRHGPDGVSIEVVGHVIRRAWMYVAIPEYWKSILSTYTFSKLKVHDAGSPLGQYTYFDKNEYVETIK